MKKLVPLLLLASLLTPLPGFAKDGPQSPLTPGQLRKEFPKIVLYSVSWCPYCKNAKEYLTQREIPFINRDVEIDATAMSELTGKYKSQAVPVLVIGEDEKIVKGFTPEIFEQALQEVMRK